VVRVLLFTGKGGVGKTTTAAATAVLAARRGLRTIVLSTDPAHSLADALGVPLGPEPTEIAPRLRGQQVDTQRRFEESWDTVRTYLKQLLGRGGVDELVAEQLTVLPGAQEVLALLEVRSRVAAGDADLVVVDCAPTAETLRLLALPGALDWYFAHAFGGHRRLARAARPLLGGSALLPPDDVFGAVQRLHADLADVQELLTDPARTGVRLVLTPESVVVAESRRTLTALSLYGFAVDAVVANRVIPAGDDPWRAGWAAAQQARLAEVRASFAGLPVHLAPYLPAEPVGLAALAEHGERIYADADPLGAPPPVRPLGVRADGEEAELSLPLPLAERADVDLSRTGDDLVVTVAGQRRVVALPEWLGSRPVTGASLADGRLVVRFGAPSRVGGAA
jgi:arsenite/tail-anchored protein-transporting ATPase